MTTSRTFAPGIPSFPGSPATPLWPWKATRNQSITSMKNTENFWISSHTFIPGSPAIPWGPAGQAAGHLEKKGQRTNLTLGTKPTDRLATELRPLKPLWSSEERFVWEMYRHQNNCHASRTYLTGSKTVIHSQGPHFPHCWHRAVPTTQQSDI